MKQRIARLIRGRSGGSLDEHAIAIRELQQRLEELTTVVARVDVDTQRAVADSSALPEALRVAVDDLGARIATMTDRLNELEGVSYQLADVVAAQTVRPE